MNKPRAPRLDVSEMSETPAAAVFWRPILEMQGALIAFARGVVGDAELARDIVQDAYVDAWRAACQQSPPFASITTPTTPTTPTDLTGIRRWLFTVTYRHALKHLRRRNIIAWEPLDEQSSTAPAPLASPHFEDAVAEAEALRGALLSIPPEDAACFLLQAVHGFSTAEIAATLGVRPDAIRQRLSRARRRLQAAYSAQSEAHSPQSSLDAREGR